MGYRVKWIEEHLGVTRKMLRVYEKAHLLPPNLDGKYRDYSEEEVATIWEIRVLRGIGFSLQEIREMIIEGKITVDETIGIKIKKLEEEKDRLEKQIGYARFIKLSGAFPLWPKEGGETTFADFYDQALRGWNINSEPGLATIQDLLDMNLQYKKNHEFTDKEMDTITESLAVITDYIQKLIQNSDSYIKLYTIPEEILKLKEDGPASPEIQTLISILYKLTTHDNEEMREMTKEQYARYTSRNFVSGDIGRLNNSKYGEEGCRFLADAFAIFGGYKSYDDI